MIRPSDDILPSGCPAWITAELLASTLETWQPYYREVLTAQDGVEILLGVGRLIDILQGSTP